MSLILVWIVIKIGMALLIPCATGFFLTSTLLQSTSLKRNFGLALGLGAALGWGLHAVLYFAWRVTALPAGWLYLTEAVLLAASGLIFLRYRPYFRFPEPPALPRRWRLFLSASLVAALSFAGLAILNGYAWFPHGTWDAWSIWSLAARYFYLGGADWGQLFHINNFHPDYPPLIGASLARLWTYLGNEHPLAGGLNAVFASLTTVLLVGAALTFRRSLWIGILGALFCLGASSLLVITVAQIADIPLSMFILGVILCSFLADDLPGPQPALWVLAGAFAGLAAWTKNEGLLVVVCFLAVRVGQHLWRRDWRGFVHEQAWIWAGLLPLLVVLAGFKFVYAPPNDLVAAQGGETLARFLDPSRWRVVLAYFTFQSYTIYPKLSVPAVSLTLVLVLAGIRRDVLRSRSLWTGLAFLGLMLGGYLLVYLISPYETSWHLKTSAHRLFLHLWPSAVFLTMLLARLLEFDFRPAPPGLHVDFPSQAIDPERNS